MAETEAPAPGSAPPPDTMGGGPSRLFILRPVATSLIMLAIFLAGLVGYGALPLSALPEVDYPTIQVTTIYPGASPDVMALTVTSPLERQFGQMPGLSRMTSSSSSGASVITMQFALNLNLDVAEQEVQAAINAANTLLPSDLPSPPTYAKVNPADAPVLTLGVTSPTRTTGDVQGIVERQFSNRIAQISGVGLVSLSAGQRPAVRIRANVEALASRGLGLETIRNAISNANANAAKGSFDGQTNSWTIEANDQINQAEGYADLVIAWADKAPVRLRDVAQVTMGTENVRMGAWMGTAQAGNQPAVIVDVQRQPGANVIGTVDAIKAALPGLEAQLPGDVHVTLLTDRTAGIRASVADVRFELVLAVALVTLVIFLFLGSIRATVIASIAVPLSLVGAFALMYFCGFSINNLSLMALTIASGFVVDDAIVVLENIARHVEDGIKPFDAALRGAREIGFTIISLTVSLIAVLIPLLFMGDVVGRLFREFAVTLALTILISAVVALTLVPMLASRWLRADTPADHGGDRRHQALTRWTRDGFAWLTRHYGAALDWVLARPRLTLAVFGASVALTVALFVIIPKSLFPEQDTGQIALTTRGPQDVSYARMAALQGQVAAAIMHDPAVASLSSAIGVDGRNIALSQGRLLVNLRPQGERASLSAVRSRLEAAVADTPGVAVTFRPVQDLTVDTSTGVNAYAFQLQGADENQINEWGASLAARLRGNPALAHVTSNVLLAGQAVTVDINRDLAGRLGLSAQAIDNILYDAFGQRIVSTIYSEASQNRVILENRPGAVTSPQALGDLRIPVGGTTVPLASVATIRVSPVALVVNREAQFPAATIGFDLAPGVPLGEAVSAIRQEVAAANLPPAITVSYSGAAGAFQAALANEVWLVLAAIVVVYIVLGVLYESFIHPVTILSTLPAAGIGALLALWLSGDGLGVIGVIGIVLLIGIVKKNAIMMVDFALERIRGEGHAPAVAIREAALLRFRPIMMTTFAALFAAVPLIVGGGMGYELRQPLGLAIAGGLIFSQVLTLFTTPVIFLALDRWAGEGVVGHEPAAGAA